MFIDVDDMLEDYGTNIEVWTPDMFEETWVAGKKTKPKLNQVEPLKRFEPIIPASSNASELASLINGGTIIQGEMKWLSNKEFPVNTLVRVPSQNNRVYKVTSSSNWGDYSNLVEHMLKGDDEHDYV